MANACHPAKPVPMLMINGTADPLIPMRGGRGTSRFAVPGFWSTEQTFAFWGRINGCDAQEAVTTEIDHRDPSDPTTVTQITFALSEGKRRLLYRVTEAATACPGPVPGRALPAHRQHAAGPAKRDFDGAEPSGSFLRRFSVDRTHDGKIAVAPAASLR